MINEIEQMQNDNEKEEFISKNIDNINSPYLGRAISHLDNIELLKKLINKYNSKLGYEDFRAIVYYQRTDDRKIELINYCSDYMDYRYLGRAIGYINDINKVKELIDKYKSKIGTIGIINTIYGKKNDNEKIELINYCSNYLDYKNLGRAIGYIDDINKVKELIDKYKSKIGEIGMLYTIINNKNDDKKIELIDYCSDSLDYVNLGSIIGDINDIDKVKELIDKYKSKIGEIGMLNTIRVIETDDKKVELIDYCLNYFDHALLGNAIALVNNISTTKKLINKYQNKLYLKGIRIVILSKKNDDERIDIINSFEEYVDNVNLGRWIGFIEDLNKTKDMINKYIEKIGSIGIINTIYGKKNDNEKIELITTYIDSIEKKDLMRIIHKINDFELKKDFIKKYTKNLGIDGIAEIFLNLDNYEYQSDLLESLKDIYKEDAFRIKQLENMTKLCNSNSLDVQHISKNLLLNLENIPIEKHDEILKQLEDIFIRNNLPTMAKIYKVFDIMHPNLEGFDLYKYQSPNLNIKKKAIYKQIMIFSDLFKITIGSNNRSLKNYVTNIIEGNNLVKKIINGDDINLLNENDKLVLETYLKHLRALYNNTVYGKNKTINLTKDFKYDILNLLNQFSKNEKDFNIDKLPDRIVKMFGHFAGIDDMNTLISLINNTIENADSKNRKNAINNNFEIHKGDFIKGLANQDEEDEFYTFLTNIFQNGSLCKELLGSSARSDTTPLDTDVSRLLDDPKTFEEAFTNRKYASSRYGPLWIVLKNDDRFNITSKENNAYIPNKLEAYETSMDGLGHYGIRTGFATTDIDYLVVDENKIKLDRIKYEIVMNGFYIPVLNTKGNLIFTPNEYDKLYKNMAGLKYYYTDKNYCFAKELESFDSSNLGYDIDIDKSLAEVKIKKDYIINKLREVGLNINYGRKPELDLNTIDLIDIGSTSRGTNKMDNYDFDFIMRVDKKTYIDSNKINEIFDKIKEAFPNIEIEGKNIRNQEIILPNGEKTKIDITIIMKTDKIDYSTEECINDRLNTIKNMSEEKYKKVLENIVLAKYVLKDVYKSKNSNINPQGGLGGVGIENWILQNGGSFEAAIKDFLSVAEGKNFKDFCEQYTIWDFGENNLSFRRVDGYKHDEFIKNNMNESGYNKMITVLKEYIKTSKQEYIDNLDENNKIK